MTLRGPKMAWKGMSGRSAFASHYRLFIGIVVYCSTLLPVLLALALAHPPSLINHLHCLHPFSAQKGYIIPVPVGRTSTERYLDNIG